MSGAHRWALYLDLIRWNRPAGWLLLLWPTLTALWVAAGGFPGWHLLAVFVLGTVAMRSAGCCVNDVADRAFDRHVQRTAKRPVTSGRLSPREALGLGAVLALVAFGLVLTTHLGVVLWSFAALVVAVLYPYAKRHVAVPQAVLGLAFSFGIPMAFVAVQHHVPWQAWCMVLANACWVLAYDTEYAMVDREDDLKIGIRTSAIALGRWDVAAVMCFYAASALLWWLCLPAPKYPVAHLLAGVCVAAQVAWHGALIQSRSPQGCFKAFSHNHWLGFTVFVGVVLGQGV